MRLLETAKENVIILESLVTCQLYVFSSQDRQHLHQDTRHIRSRHPQTHHWQCTGWKLDDGTALQVRKKQILCGSSFHTQLSGTRS